MRPSQAAKTMIYAGIMMFLVDPENIVCLIHKIRNFAMSRS
jgi:hypothetical protein